MLTHLPPTTAVVANELACSWGKGAAGALRGEGRGPNSEAAAAPSSTWGSSSAGLLKQNSGSRRLLFRLRTARLDKQVKPATCRPQSCTGLVLQVRCCRARSALPGWHVACHVSEAGKILRCAYSSAA